MNKEEAEKNLSLLSGWTLESDHISKEYIFDNYLRGLEFANLVGMLAEEENHHPNIFIGWKKVRLTFSTHSIMGLSRNDFIMAAKTDREYEMLKQGTAD